MSIDTHHAASRGLTPAGMRRINRGKVLAVLREHGPISRTGLTRRAGMSKATISALVGDLIERGLVRVDGPVAARRGRPPIMLRFNDGAGLVVGVDMSGPRLAAAAANLAGQIVARRDVPWPSTRPAIFTALEGIVRDVITGSRSTGRRVFALAVGSPGVVDTAHGLVVGSAPNLPRWERVPLKKILQQRLRVPVIVENDVNLALWGEQHFGACGGVRNALLFWIEQGVGGALLVDGVIHRGTHFAAGEVGYMRLPGGAGRVAALEAHVSEPAVVSAAERLAARGEAPRLARFLREGRGHRVSTVAEAARQGDRGVRRILEDAATHVGTALAPAVLYFDPEVVVIGGSIVTAGEFVQRPVEAALRRACPAPPRVVLSQLGEDAVLRGAIAAALAHTSHYLTAGGLP